MRKNQMKMSCMKVGENAIIESTELINNIKQRLIDLGLIIGTRVECILKSPFGDPTAYKIKGTLIALRKEETDKIVVKSVKKNEY